MRVSPIAFLSATIAWTQIEAQTNEILRAPQANFIYVSLKPAGSANPFDYTLDRRASGEWSKPLKPGMLITTRQKDGVNIVLEFLNPMTNSWAASDSAVDSGVGKATASFLNAVTAQFGAIGGVSPIALPAATLTKTETTRGGSATTAITLTRAVGGSTALLSWQQWLNEGRASCFTSPEAEQRVRAQADLVEAGLYGTAKTTDAGATQAVTKTAEDYRSALFSAIAALRDASNMEALRVAVSNGKKTASDLEAADQRAREATLALNVLMQGAFKQLPKSVPSESSTQVTKTDSEAQRVSESRAAAAIDSAKQISPQSILQLFETRKPDDENLRKQIAAQIDSALKKAADIAAEASAKAQAANCESFQRYSAATLQSVTSEANDLLVKRSTVVRELRNVLGSVERLLATVRSTDNDFPLGTFLPNESSDRVVCISVQKRDVSVDNERVTVTDQSLVRSCIRLSKSKSLVFEVAPGIAYSTIRYSRYGTAAGLVGKATDDIQHSVPVVMLNILPSASDGRVIGQIGVGSTRDYPAFLMGVGARFSNVVDWSLTAGAIWSWDRFLKTLKAGDAVSGTAAIDSDIGYELRSRPSAYIGLQIGIPE